MNTRQCDLLGMLLAQPHYTPLEEYAERLSCSSKTVSHDVRALNVSFKAKGLASCIEGKRGSGIRLVVAPEEEVTLAQLMLLDVGNAMTSYERFYKGLSHLVMEGGRGCDVDDLAALLFTNKRQLSEDISHWNALLELFGQKIVHRRGMLVVEGGEYSLRAAVLYFFYLVAPYYQRATIEGYVSASAAEAMELLADVLGRVYGAAFSRNAVRAGAFYLAVAQRRIESGCAMGLGDIPGHLETEGPATEAVLEVLAPFFEGLDDEHARAEAAVLLAAHAFSAMGDFEGLLPHVDAASRSYAHALRSALERTTGRPLPLMLAQSLEYLCFQAIQRARSEFPVAMVNAAPMKREHLDWFMQLEAVIRADDDLAGIPILSDDLARIAMLLFPYWEEQHGKTWRAVLVSDASYEHASYACSRVAARLPFVEVDRAVSRAEARKLAAKGAPTCDFLIAFEPLELALPVCHISDAVDDGDILRIAEFAFGLEEPAHARPVSRATRSLAQKNIASVAEAIFWDLSSEGLIRASKSAFLDQFYSHCTVATEAMTTVVALPGTAATSFRLYRTSNLVVVQPVGTVAVCVVSDHDIDVLGKVVRQFNDETRPLTKGERAYTLPFDLLRLRREGPAEGATGA